MHEDFETFGFPLPPEFSQELREHCEKTGDYKPMLFEWYRYVGLLAVTTACIAPESHCFKKVDARHYHILVGLLNRCARLMLSNVALSHERRFGETTAIIDRCILETAIKLIWLCQDTTEEKISRYLASGLKTEIEFKSIIEKNIKTNGRTSALEQRMLNSVANHIQESGLTPEEILNAKKLPNLDSMADAVGYDRLFYVATQKMGSHHVHGTWPSLLFHYLSRNEEGRLYKFGPRDHDCDTHINQFMLIPRIILHALGAYAYYFFDDPTAKTFTETLQSIDAEITNIYETACENPDGPEVS